MQTMYAKVIYSLFKAIMTKRFVREAADIDQCPTLMQPLNITADDVTLGDLHGNFLKLLYFLVRQGAISLSPSHYNALAAHYKTPNADINLQHLLEFKALIQSIIIHPPFLHMRLLGDELSDRGSNDYYTLLLLEKLRQANSRLTIVLSNHGAEFIEAYECFVKRYHHLIPIHLGPHFAPSLISLNALIQKGLITEERVFALIEKAYKPCIRLVDYSIDKKNNGMTLYTHAAIGLETLRALAQCFFIPFEDKTLDAFCLTLNHINHFFKEKLDKHQAHTLFQNPRCEPLHTMLWNRSYEHLERPHQYQGYTLSYVHGHDSGDTTEGHLYNLDNTLGKMPRLHQGEYTVLLSDELSIKE